MIQSMTHTTVYVEDQARALDFYVGKLGFEVSADMTMPDGFRWLTVSPKGQALNIILMKVGTGGTVSKEDAETLRGLIRRGVIGPGVFGTADCQKTYDELVAKGVEFVSPPKDQFYAIEALMKDPFGNWFSVTQQKGR